ncbi:unnamed protein product [Amoebophrya sp. A120]|nr:unnamed protein product [Amoebophrya sp. A120]|eukprot:GSA120T00000373001.1
MLALDSCARPRVFRMYERLPGLEKTGAEHVWRVMGAPVAIRWAPPRARPTLGLAGASKVLAYAILVPREAPGAALSLFDAVGKWHAAAGAEPPGLVGEAKGEARAAPGGPGCVCAPPLQGCSARPTYLEGRAVRVAHAWPSSSARAVGFT